MGNRLTSAKLFWVSGAYLILPVKQASRRFELALVDELEDYLMLHLKHFDERTFEADQTSEKLLQEK